MAKRRLSPAPVAVLGIVLLWCALPIPGHTACTLGHYQNTAKGVKDLSTGHLWAKCLSGQKGASCKGEAQTLTHMQAETLLHLTPGWRLPSHDELLTLVQNDCAAGHINSVYFPNSGTVAAWTDSAATGVGSYWTVDFNTGFDDIADRTSAKVVRLIYMVAAP